MSRNGEKFRYPEFCRNHVDKSASNGRDLFCSLIAQAIQYHLALNQNCCVWRLLCLYRVIPFTLLFTNASTLEASHSSGHIRTMQDPTTDQQFQNAAPGALIHGRYKIERELGAGAQANVFLAQDVHLMRAAALKIFNRTEPAVIERFKKEAHMMATLDHPNIVKIYASGATDDGRHFIAMEFVEGASLANYLQKQGKLSANEFITIFTQIISALIYLHENSILHRDLKPENILLSITAATDEIKAKLVDFGIAKIYDESKSSASTTQTMGVGTAAYMSPEQCQAQKIDKRSDIYALGCVMYQALAGKPPFQGESEYEVMYKHTSSVVPKLSVPAELEILVSKALAKQAAERWQSAGEMLDAMPSPSKLSDLVSEPKERSTTPNGKMILIPLAVLTIMGAGGFFLQIHKSESSKALVRTASAASLKPLGDYKKVQTFFQNTATQELQLKAEGVAKKLLADTEAAKEESVKHRQLAWNFLARLEHGRGQREKSLYYSEKALEEVNDPKVRDLDSSLHEAAYTNHAMMLQAASRFEDAIKEWQRAIEYAKQISISDRSRTLAFIYSSMGTNYISQNNYALAEQFTRKAIKAASTDIYDEGLTIDSDYQLARILIKKGNFDEAESLIRTIRDVTRANQPTNTYHYGHWPERLINFAGLYSSKGNYKKAIEYSQEAESVYGEKMYNERFGAQSYTWSCRSQGLTSLARYYALTHKIDLAAKTYKKAVDNLAPQKSAHCVDTLVQLGACALQDGFENEAVRAWTLAEEKTRLFHDTIAGEVGAPPGILLGNYYLRKDEPTKAKQYFTSALNFLRANQPSRIKEIEAAKLGLKRARRMETDMAS